MNPKLPTMKDLAESPLCKKLLGNFFLRERAEKVAKIAWYLLWLADNKEREACKRTYKPTTYGEVGTRVGLSAWEVSRYYLDPINDITSEGEDGVLLSILVLRKEWVKDYPIHPDFFRRAKECWNKDITLDHSDPLKKLAACQQFIRVESDKVHQAVRTGKLK